MLCVSYGFFVCFFFVLFLTAPFKLLSLVSLTLKYTDDLWNRCQENPTSSLWGMESFFFFYPQSLRVAVLKVVSKAALRSLFTVLQLLCLLLLLWLSNKSLVPWKPLSCLLFSHFHLLPLKSYTVLLITSAWYCNLITH